MELTKTLRAALSGGLLTLALMAAPVANAQDNPLDATPACGLAEPDSASQSPETLLGALYQILSGPAGSNKDWGRLNGLFAPGALVTPTWHGALFLAAPQTPQQFSELNQRLLGNRGFFERETRHQIQVFGHVAHVWSTFETTSSADGPVRARGVNSFQLLNDGKRWCILSATWDLETPAHPIPPEFDRTGAGAGAGK